MFHRPSASNAPTPVPALGNFVARLRKLAGMLSRPTPTLEGHPPATPSLGAWGLLAGERDRFRN